MTSDCLVIFLEDSSRYIDLFILYDNLKKSFYMCGKKVSTINDNDAIPFSFYCKHEKNIKQFIDVIMDDRLNIHIYNFNDLPSRCDDITFDTLHERRREESKIITYFENHYYYDNFDIQLEIIKNIKNDYIL